MAAWVPGVVMLLRMIVAVCSMSLLVRLGAGAMKPDESGARPWQVLAAILGACGGLTFLVLMPFDGPG